MTLGAGSRLLLATLVVLATAAPSASAAAAPQVRRQAKTTVELVSQTPMVHPGDRAEFVLSIDEAPGDALLRLDVHGPVATRSEFIRSTDGDGLRGIVSSSPAVPIDELRTSRADGSVRIPLLLDPQAPGGAPITVAGIYPVRIRITDPAGSTMSTLVTHLVVVDEADESPPLAVAVVADLGASPATGSDGRTELEASNLDRLSTVVDALATSSDVPLNLAINPETVDALASDGSARSADLLNRLRELARSRTVLHRPYAEVSAQALADHGLIGELDHHLARGRDVISGELDVEPTTGMWLADDDLAPTGARALADRGFRHLVVDAEQVEPLPPAHLSLAQRFQIELPAAEGTTGPAPGAEAIEVDPRLDAHLHDGVAGPLAAQRLLAELAVVWNERPAAPRAAVLVADARTPATVLAGVLEGLDAGGVVEAVSLPEAFFRTEGVTDASGAPIARPLTPAPAEPFPPELPALVGEARVQLGGFESLIGSGSPRALPLHTQLLLATARGIEATDRLRHVEVVTQEVGGVLGAVHVPDQPRVTLTSRVATIPITVENDAGFPMDVVVHVQSQKLEFPDGNAIPLSLSEPTTRLDLQVRTLASGAFPLDVVVTSPDGALELTRTRYRMQSTAVSGVGLIISAGAGLFLLAWWISHWRRARRSRRLVPLQDVG